MRNDELKNALLERFGHAPGLFIRTYGCQQNVADSERIRGLLYECGCVVTGYGRIGKALSSMLCSLGAKVTVCARRASDRALARSTGCGVVGFDRLPRTAECADIIFNTADADVITKEVIDNMRPGALILDLASAPWGTDDLAAAQRGVNVMHCPGLPGKYSSVTAAGIIKDAVLNITEYTYRQGGNIS